MEKEKKEKKGSKRGYPFQRKKSYKKEKQTKNPKPKPTPPCYGVYSRK